MTCTCFREIHPHIQHINPTQECCFSFSTPGHLLAPRCGSWGRDVVTRRCRRGGGEITGREVVALSFDMQQPLIIHHVTLVICDLLQLFTTDWPFHFWRLKLNPSVFPNMTHIGGQLLCLQTGALCESSQFEILSTFSQHRFCPSGTFNSSICGVKLFMRLPHVLWTRSEWFMASWRMSAESLNAFQSYWNLNMLGLSLSFQARFHFAVSEMANYCSSLQGCAVCAVTPKLTEM